MSPLAESIYRVLVRRIKSRRRSPLITYSELGRRVGAGPRSQALHSALGEIVRRCRRRRLPALPALVVRHDAGRPGKVPSRPVQDYYWTAHRLRGGPELVRSFAWAIEVASVRDQAANYPPDPAHL